jgi:NAD-dependent SIR2 family protein deacetylase
MSSLQSLLVWFESHPRVAVLTGAGISTASGIPAYRDAQANWMRKAPVTHQAFVADPATRRRYWARSMLGWPLMRDARPNAGHRALAALAAAGHVSGLVTQNVDALHERAGHSGVIALHGRLDRVICLDCGLAASRDVVQTGLLAANPAFAERAAGIAPDGDADLEGDFATFREPECPSCGGRPMPDVVFYGGAVPRERAAAAAEVVARAAALLIVGSSLMVRSAYRLCEQAHAAGKPIAAINLGKTRADALIGRKWEIDGAEGLAMVVDRLGLAADL